MCCIVRIFNSVPANELLFVQMMTCIRDVRNKQCFVSVWKVFQFSVKPCLVMCAYVALYCDKPDKQNPSKWRESIMQTGCDSPPVFSDTDTNGHLPENKSYLKLSYFFSPWQSRVPVATERVKGCGACIYTESCWPSFYCTCRYRIILCTE